MKCSKCYRNETKIIDSRSIADGTQVRRRHECLKCKQRFTSYERCDESLLAQQNRLMKNGLQMISNEKDDSLQQTSGARIANGILYKLMENSHATYKSE
jgi:hypothetical protein